MSPPNSAPHSSHDLNWYPDTGATNHVTSDLGNLNLQAEEYNGSDQLRVGNGQGLDTKHLGSSQLHYPHVSFTLQNLLHVPNIQKNLLSVSQFTRDNNVFFEFHPHFFCVKDPQTGTTLLRGQSKNGLYTLPSIPPLTRFALVGERTSLDRWHCRLGHPSLRIVSQVVRTNALATLKNKASTVCHACRLGKSHELPFHLSSSISMHPLDLLFTDVWGPSPSPSINGKRYYVCFVDDFSKFTWLFPIAAKSEVTSILLSFQKHVEKLFDRKIKAIQLDWGGEFRSLNSILAKQGISHRISCSHTHQQQGLVERKHRHLVETGLSLLASASMPLKYWDEAFLTASFLINRLPSPVTQHKSPFELLFHKAPDYNFLKVFGCACWLHLRPYKTNKLDLRSKLCVFLGYSLQHRGYRYLHLPSSRIYISRHVVFDENNFPFNSVSPPPLSCTSRPPVSSPICPFLPISTHPFLLQ